jgi:hypothetical protein
MDPDREPVCAARPDPAELCDAWRRRSLANGRLTALDREQHGPGTPEGPGERGEPPLALVGGVAEGWAEEGMARLPAAPRQVDELAP